MTQTDDSLHSGNTCPECSPRTRSRAWFITSFNDPLQHFDNAKYECWCDDETEKGDYHFHQTIVFENQIYFNTIKKKYPTAHIQKPWKDVYHCIKYCEKTEETHKTNFQEIGQRPVDTRFKTVGELKECKDPELLDWKQYNTWTKIQSAPQKIKRGEWKKDVKVFYICGPSGIGKSEKIEELLDEQNISEFEEVKHAGEFWLGIVDGKGTCVYDDWRDSHMTASEFINFIDYRIHSLNIKGGSVKNNYNYIFISTVQRPENIYRNLTGEPREQWMRRMNIINLYKDDDEEVF